MATQQDRERAGRLMELWKNQPYSLAVKQKDDVGRAYLRHVIGVDETTIDAFLQPNNPVAESRASHTIGMRHSIGMKRGEVEPMKNDYQAFWRKVGEIAPEFHSSEDLDWLIAINDIFAPWQFVCFIGPFCYGDSSVLTKISANAHAYK